MVEELGIGNKAEQFRQLPLEGFEERPSKVDVLRAVIISLGGYDREAFDVLASAIPEPSTLVSKIRDALGNRRILVSLP